ncbi:hypothetical protein [Roseibium sp. RKSG952]|uniref:hypothetical protein n=1 Tax=Roseibium sp. RKSG952 TaxID=2529384 RepID=UPI0012BBE5EF|nr:hypothetical protein [Roseibium sp. RKSG952]MTH95347.1 hypothetical protein [Roseibium sp. RKSG952]
MTRHSGNFSIAPNSVDAVIRTDDGLVFSVNGFQCEISILQGDEISLPELQLAGQGGTTSVLFKGGIGEVAARLEEIHHELIVNMSREVTTPFYKRKGFVASAAVVAVLAAVGLVHPQSTNFLRGLEMHPHTVAPMDEGLIRHFWNPALTAYPRSAPETERADISNVTTAPDIFDIPGRAMPDPNETTLFPGSVGLMGALADENAGIKEMNKRAKAVEKESLSDPAKALVPMPLVEPDQPGLLGDIKRMSAASASPPEVSPSEVTELGVLETSADPVDGETPKTTPVVGEKKITKQIITAISNGSMSAEHAQSFLEALGELKSNNPHVTKAMLQDLPEDVTSMLAQTGLLDELMAVGEGDTEYRIIRLPEDIIELYRGSDGIASIPERFSWAATGNYVSLPLPGGGDVKRAEHMKEFGLNLQ